MLNNEKKGSTKMEHQDFGVH